MYHSLVSWEIILLYFFSWNFIWFGQIMMENLNKNRFVVSKMARICWILIQALKSLNNLHFDWSFLCKVYNVWPKMYRKLSFMTLKYHTKFEEKLTCALENGMRDYFTSFHQNTCKYQNWDFDMILLSKIEDAWAKKLQGSYV